MSQTKRKALFFPWDEVRSAFDGMDVNLGTTPVDFAKELFSDQKRDCPECGRESDELCWISIGSNDEAWKAGDNRCGWLTVCEDCMIQVSFFREEEMIQLRREGNW